jgi:crotonobetainyl-CoA:carnitine CoA-transferase CaiB-like acyl-CoA transferase
MWQSLCGVLGLPELLRDPRFTLNEDRYANRAALWPIIEAAFMRKPAKAWVPLLQEAGIPVAEVNNLKDALDNPQVRHRDMVLEIAAADGKRVSVVGNPVKMSRTARDGHDFPPALGGDTRAVLAETLGMPEAEISDFIARGVVKEKGTK